MEKFFVDYVSTQLANQGESILTLKDEMDQKLNSNTKILEQVEKTFRDMIEKNIKLNEKVDELEKQLKEILKTNNENK